MQLDQLQTGFATALLDANSSPPPGIVGKAGAPATRRFAVYRNNVIASLVDALKAGFPVTASIVGDEFFRAMASVFVRSHPPSSPILMLYGDELPAFLEAFPPVGHLGYLPDVARLEQLRREAYHAADAKPLPGDFLDKVSPGDLPFLRISISPSVRLLASDYPVMSLWHWHDATDADERQPLPDAGENVLLNRQDGVVTMRRLAPGAIEFFAALKDGAPLETALASANNHEGFDLTESITTLIDSRIATHIS